MVSVCACSGQPIMLDETTNIAFLSGTSVVQDAGARDGACIFRSAAASGGTMWFGPYTAIPAGNYLVSFRMKVASNASGAPLIYLDVSSPTPGLVFSPLHITPNMFSKSGAWEIFTIPVTIPHGAQALEFRGLGFQSGVTDLSLDYIEINRGDVAGIYTPDFALTNNGRLGIGMGQPK